MHYFLYIASGEIMGFEVVTANIVQTGLMGFD